MPKATKALPDLRAAVDAAEGRRSHSAFDSWVKDDPKRAEDTHEPCEGQCYREGREIVIEVAKRLHPTTRLVVDTVIHECAHAILWPPARAESRQAHHPPAFWAQYGEIRDRFDHDLGWEEAAEYPTE